MEASSPEVNTVSSCLKRKCIQSACPKSVGLSPTLHVLVHRLRFVSSLLHFCFYHFFFLLISWLDVHLSHQFSFFSYLLLSMVMRFRSEVSAFILLSFCYFSFFFFILHIRWRLQLCFRKTITTGSR